MTQEENQTLSALPLDAISVAVGCKHYVRSHRFAQLYIDSPVGRSPRLAVSRYYWDLPVAVAVDFVRELRFGEAELATKKAYFKDRDIRYLLVRDAFDGEGAEKELLQYLPSAEQAQAVKDAAKPLTGPRRRQSQSA